MSKSVILTGLRANEDLHIGNYFGALLPIVDLAKTKSSDYQINLFVPDLHSFTTPIDHSKLQSNILNNLKIFVAAGLPIDNHDVYLYRQSYVPAHSELTWILDCFTALGEMNRMTQFKDKSAKMSNDRINLGLYHYPVLMAADILLYDAEYVPVGDDQSQHLEFTRNLSGSMNAKFAQNLFVVPRPTKDQHEFFGKDQGLRIKDLADPTKKMSKSDDTQKGVIFLGDNPEDAYKKIMSATTDDKANVKYDPENQPGVSNLLQIYALMSGMSVEQAEQEFAGQTQYGEFKKVVAEKTVQFLNDFQSKLSQVDEQLIHSKLTDSEAKMNEQANKTLLRVQKAVGLR